MQKNLAGTNRIYFETQIHFTINQVQGRCFVWRFSSKLQKKKLMADLKVFSVSHATTLTSSEI